MSAEISVFQAVVATINGVPYGDVGSITVSVKGSAASIEDGANPIRRIVRVPAGEKVNLWTWEHTGGFAYLTVRPVDGEGFTQLAVRYTPATDPDDDADLTPTGLSAYAKWNEVGKSCVGTFDLDSERAFLDPHTPANNAADTDGSPSVWTSADRELGVADIVRAWNRGTDDVLLEVVVFPK